MPDHRHPPDKRQDETAALDAIKTKLGAINRDVQVSNAIFSAILTQLTRIADAVVRNNPKLIGGAIVFVVKDDNPDVAYSITAPSVTDAEGNPIPDAQLAYEVSSDAPDVVSITPNADSLTGTVHFGSPGQAAINVNIKTGETLLGAFGAQFTVTTGDPAAISGGSIAFDGLTEA